MHGHSIAAQIGQEREKRPGKFFSSCFTFCQPKIHQYIGKPPEAGQNSWARNNNVFLPILYFSQFGIPAGWNLKD
jgi:hypothetical protein